MNDAAEVIDLAAEESDPSTAREIESDVSRAATEVERLEFQRMFPGKMDSHNAFLDIQAGAGGTEAQDWAAMLLRMYLKWADAHGIKTEVIDQSPGEVAGIKGATASAQVKPATLETGLVVQVPPFVNEGDKIRVGITDHAQSELTDVVYVE